MKLSIAPFTVSALLALSIFAEAQVSPTLPGKIPASRYSSLVTKSPFTSDPPPPPPPEPDGNPLEDFALGGVSPIPGGYRITLINRKEPENPIFINTDRSDETHGFQVLEVRNDRGSPLETIVRLSTGRTIGTVTFDEALLSLKPAPQQQRQNPADLQQRLQQQLQEQQNSGEAQTRQRVMPPNQGGQPQVPTPPVPGQQGRPNQPQGNANPALMRGRGGERGGGDREARGRGRRGQR